MNLYNYLNPIANPAMFFGRQSELDEALRALRDGKSFALIGGSRSGKTSLLFMMKRILLDELDRSASCVVGPVFLSTHELPRLSPASIYGLIVKKFKDEICRTKKPGWDVDATRLLDPRVTDEQAPAIFQDILKDLLARVSPDLRIVILLDEVDVLQEYEWSRMFFLNLRNLISQGELKGHLALLLAGTVAINQLYKVAGSPFLNVVKRVRTILPLTDEEATALIQTPSGNRVQEPACEAILRETGGHPFLVQFIMEHLCDQFGERIGEATAADVTCCVQQFFDERYDFDSWAAGFREGERIVYRLIADSDRPVSKAEILGVVTDASEANRILELLTHLGVIRKLSRTSFARGGDMFSAWFYENMAADRAQPVRTTAPATTSRKMLEVLKIVLASPGDVSTERQLTAQVIERLNRGVAREHGYYLDLYRWETDAQPGLHPLGAQGAVDEGLDIENCDLLIGVFWLRFGTPTKDAGSGTESEIRTAIRNWKAGGHPQVMLYFSQKAGMPANARGAEQLAQVLRFKEEMGSQSLYWEYQDENEFREQLDSHLANYVRKELRIRPARDMKGRGA